MKKIQKIFLDKNRFWPYNSNVHVERYRSGHNEAVLKTVWAHAHVGSNPTLSAIHIIWRSTQVAIRGAPAKGIGR